MLLRACDIDKRIPAKTYTITADDGRSVSKDLCAEHGEPFEEWLEEAKAGEPAAGDLEIGREWLDAEGEEKRPGEKESEPKPAPAPPERAAPKRAATRRTATKKAAPSRRRPKIVSLEEIEAQKKG